MLDGKIALVTGGTRGIGRAIVEYFVKNGATVAFSGRDTETGRRTLDELDAGDRTLFIPGDVTSQDDVRKMVDTPAERYGRLDILVNNAGGMPGFGLIASTDDATWHSTIDINLHSVFYATRQALTHMVPQRSGRIITISSILGKQGDPGLGAYAAAKSAVIGMTQALAREVGQFGITANCICPGIVMTDMIRTQGPLAAQTLGVTYEQVVDAYTGKTAIGRATAPDEVAAMAVLLASQAGAGITGSALSVDGGATGS